MTIQLKQRLLATDRFLDNEYLEKYVNLVINERCAPIKGETQSHHIIPRYYFESVNEDVDDSNENRVTLLYKDHILAHYYLALCSNNSIDKARNVLSIRYVLAGSKLEDMNIHEIDWYEIQTLYKIGREYTYVKSHTPEINRKISETLKGRISPNKGNKKRFCRPSRANPNAKNKKLSEIASKRVGDKNSFYGKTHSEEFKNMISEKNSKPVIMRDLVTHEVLKEFKSMKLAADYLKYNNIANSTSIVTRISRVCNSDNPNLCAYGYNWRFTNKV